MSQSINPQTLSWPVGKEKEEVAHKIDTSTGPFHFSKQHKLHKLLGERREKRAIPPSNETETVKHTDMQPVWECQRRGRVETSSDEIGINLTTTLARTTVTVTDHTPMRPTRTDSQAFKDDFSASSTIDSSEIFGDLSPVKPTRRYTQDSLSPLFETLNNGCSQLQQFVDEYSFASTIESELSSVPKRGSNKGRPVATSFALTSPDQMPIRPVRYSSSLPEVPSLQPDVSDLNSTDVLPPALPTRQITADLSTMQAGTKQIVAGTRNDQSSNSSSDAELPMTPATSNVTLKQANNSSYSQLTASTKLDLWSSSAMLDMSSSDLMPTLPIRQTSQSLQTK
jgi:hypothetical protein